MMFNNLKSNVKLLATLWLIGLFFVFITGWYSCRSVEMRLSEAAFNQLATIHEAESRRFEAYFGLIRKQLLIFSEDRMTIQAMNQFKNDYHDLKVNPTGDQISAIEGYYQENSPTRSEVSPLFGVNYDSEDLPDFDDGTIPETLRKALETHPLSQNLALNKKADNEWVLTDRGDLVHRLSETDSKIEQDLNQAVLPAGWAEILTIKDDTVPSQEADGEWLIADVQRTYRVRKEEEGSNTYLSIYDKGKERTYSVKKEGDRLNIYSSPEADSYLPKDNTAIALQALYIAQNSEDPKYNLDKADDGSKYSKSHAEYHPAIRNYLKQFSYSDIFLIDTEGHVVYSVSKKVDYATSLSEGPLSESALAKAFEAVRTVSDKDRDVVGWFDFQPYAPSGRNLALFAAAPIFDGEQKIGVLVFQVSQAQLDEIMAVNHSMMSSLKTFLVFQGHYTEAVKDAPKEIPKTKRTTDEEGIPVLIAYTRLNVEDTQQVVLSQINEAEALSPPHPLKKGFIVMTISLVPIFVVTLAALIAKKKEGEKPKETKDASQTDNQAIEEAERIEPVEEVKPVNERVVPEKREMAGGNAVPLNTETPTAHVATETPIDSGQEIEEGDPQPDSPATEVGESLGLKAEGASAEDTEVPPIDNTTDNTEEPVITDDTEEPPIITDDTEEPPTSGTEEPVITDDAEEDDTEESVTDDTEAPLTDEIKPPSTDESEVIDEATVSEDTPLGESGPEWLVALKEEDEQAYGAEFSEDEEITTSLNLFKNLSKKVPVAIKPLKENFDGVWDDTGLNTELGSDVPQELNTNLSNRKESLDLCLKMLNRLDRFFPQFDEIIGKEEDISPLNMIQWDQEPAFEATQGEDLETEEAQLKEKIEAVRNHNYHLLRQKRELLNQLKDFFFNFFQRHFFPIVDGLDSGRKFFEDHRSEWLSQFADHAELIQQRAGIYEQLIDTTHAFLEGLSIEQISVRRGDRFDEQKHDPFMVEKDAQLQTNQIKEVNQKGYWFTDPQTETVYIIRPPQVVVVKNE